MSGFSEDTRFYGRRKGKPLRAARRHLVETLLPRLSVPAGDGPLDPAALFARPIGAVQLEIGFGGGEHLVAQALARPDVGFIGAEVFEYGIGKALSQIEATGAANIRLWPDDVRLLLDRLPDGCLNRLFVLFPDPWPKARHARRRMIQSARLDVFARLLCDGGELRVASDDPGYVRWTLMLGTDHPAFEWTARRAADWRTPPPDWVETRYEAKARAAGREPAYIIFRRRARSDQAVSGPARPTASGAGP